MFKIGDFSRLCQLSVRALRYYDEYGLLKPARVDRETGYRFYTAQQLPRLHRILALKDLGFSLEQIAGLLHGDLPAEQIRGMLRLRQVELQQQLAEERARLARVEMHLQQMEGEGKMPTYDVVVKKVAAQHIAAVRGVVPTYADIGWLFGELCPYLEAKRASYTGPAQAIYYDGEYRERDVDIEVALPITGDVPAHGRVTVRELPGMETMACVIHQGSYETIGQAYIALLAWVEANNYQAAGPNREVYLVGPGAGGTEPATYVTEVQLPVTKNS